MSPNALRRSAAVLVTLTALAVVASPALAQTSTTSSWTQFQGGSAHTGTLASGPQPPFRVRWTFPAPDGTALSGPVISGNVAIALDQDAVVAVDLASGQEAWHVDRQGGPLSNPAITTGARPLVLFLDGGSTTPNPSPSATGSPSASASTSPTATSTDPTASATPSSASTSSATATSNSSVSLVAVSLATHHVVWRTPIPAETRTGVTVDGDTAYVGDVGGNVTAVATRDGTVRWTADAAGRIDVPLSASNGIVAAVSRDVDGRQLSLSAFNESDGSPAWQPQVLRLASTAASAPAIAGGDLLVGMPDRLLHAVSASTGTERWTSIVLSVFSPVTAPAIADGSIYVADLSGGLYALDAATGSRRWTYQFNELVLRSAPVRSGRYVLLGLQNGRLVAVDDATGHLAWESPATPGLIGAIALAPGVVVAVKGGNAAGLVAFEPDASGRLIDLPSPTELDAGTTFGRIGAAAAIALVIVLVPGLLSRRRFGDAFADAEPEDAAEDGG